MTTTSRKSLAGMALCELIFFFTFGAMALSHWVKSLRCYGHVIVDECHHVSADSFEAVLKAVGALRAGPDPTPVRRDNQQPVLFTHWRRTTTCPTPPRA
jgi:hypothetical protein